MGINPQQVDMKSGCWLKDHKGWAVCNVYGGTVWCGVAAVKAWPRVPVSSVLIEMLPAGGRQVLAALTLKIFQTNISKHPTNAGCVLNIL